MSQQIQIISVLPQEKGRKKIRLDNGAEFLLYRNECKKFGIAEEEYLDEEVYHTIMEEVLATRAIKRAMHLLEKQDRTKKQLYDKLKQNGYPDECIEKAIDYVENYQYIDDSRYAQNYIRFHQKGKSRQRLKMDLMKKGITKDLIEQALEEEYVDQEQEQIRALLEKKNFFVCKDEPKEVRKIYQFLLRRGFQSSDISYVMREMEKVEVEEFVI